MSFTDGLSNPRNRASQQPSSMALDSGLLTVKSGHAVTLLSICRLLLGTDV